MWCPQARARRRLLSQTTTNQVVFAFQSALIIDNARRHRRPRHRADMTSCHCHPVVGTEPARHPYTGAPSEGTLPSPAADGDTIGQPLHLIEDFSERASGRIQL